MKRVFLIILLLSLPLATSYLAAVVAISRQTMYVDSTYSIATGAVLFFATPVVAIVGSIYSHATRKKPGYAYKSLYGYLIASVALSIMAFIYIMNIDLYPSISN